MADHYERRGRIATHVWNALTYPIFVSIVGVITVIFLLAVVIPRFESVFSDMGQALPLPTRPLMAAGGFFSGFWWLPPAVTAFIVMSLKSITAAPAGRAAWHRLILRLPVAGSLARRTALARFTRVTGTLMLSGVTILKAIELAAANCGNLEVARRLAPVLDATREGKPLASAFQNTGLFDPFTVDITAVSEETGALPAALTEIAERYDEDVITAVQRLTSVLEPAVIVALGVAVAFIVAAMLLPILQLNLSSF
jgi:type II secretory pathway component PulF